jgi:hypothetical protein
MIDFRVIVEFGGSFAARLFSHFHFRIPSRLHSLLISLPPSSPLLSACVHILTPLSAISFARALARISSSKNVSSQTPFYCLRREKTACETPHATAQRHTALRAARPQYRVLTPYHTHPDARHNPRAPTRTRAPAIYAVCSLPADCNHVLRKATPPLEAHARRAPRTYDPQYKVYQVRARPRLLHRVPSSLRSRRRCSTCALGTSPSSLRHAPRPLYLSHHRRPHSRLPRKTACSIPAMCGARGTHLSSLMSLPFLPRARRPLRAKDRLRCMTSALDRTASAIVLHTTRGNRFPHTCGS